LPSSVEPPAPGREAFGQRAARRRERATRVGAPHLVPAGLALVAAIVIGSSWGSLRACGRATVTSPETQVREALAAQRRAGLPDVYGFRAGGIARLDELRYADVQVAVAGQKARVVAVVEASGRVVWGDEDAGVTYIGRESFAMTPCSAAGWCADGDQFDRLRGVLATLFRRQDATNAGDVDAHARLLSDAYREPGGKAAAVARLRAEAGAEPRPRVRVAAWQIRVERDDATVGEDLDLVFADGATERRRVVLALAREGERWRIVSGP
jgi:hypothetical protein